VADGARSLILDQVANGLAVRMAVLYLLGGGMGVSNVPPAQPKAEPMPEPLGNAATAAHSDGSK
jgi:hypothetical protein